MDYPLKNPYRRKSTPGDGEGEKLTMPGNSDDGQGESGTGLGTRERYGPDSFFGEGEDEDSKDILSPTDENTDEQMEQPPQDANSDNFVGPTSPLNPINDRDRPSPMANMWRLTPHRPRRRMSILDELYHQRKVADNEAQDFCKSARRT